MTVRPCPAEGGKKEAAQKVLVECANKREYTSQHGLRPDQREKLRKECSEHATVLSQGSK